MPLCRYRHDEASYGDQSISPTILGHVKGNNISFTDISSAVSDGGVRSYLNLGFAEDVFTTRS